MIIRPDSHYQQSPLRLVRGTKLADIPNDPPPKLSEIESAFDIAEYLALLIRHDPHDIQTLVAVPEGMASSRKRSKGSGSGDDRKNLWIYEHLRRLPVDLTVLVTSLLGTCTVETCPKMKADEWQFLCTAHGTEGAEECSAIDYILHTLDSTSALLTSHEVFPSRITIQEGSIAHFPSLFRRLSRIFSHAYYSHRELFQLAEVETSLYARFVALCEKYDLVGRNLLPIPRTVVADTIDGKQISNDDDDNDNDPDSEEDEVEEDEDEEEERGSRRREKDEEVGRRPHSLDRHARPHKLEDLRQKVDVGMGTVKGKPDGGKAEQQQEKETAFEPEVEPTSSTTSATPAETEPASDPISSTPTTTQTMNPDPISLSTTKTYSLKPRFPKEKNSNNGTLGRSTIGKKSRGTMLWSSDTTPTPTPITPETSEETSETIPLDRTDSIETAILEPEDLEGEGPLPPSKVDLVNDPEQDRVEEEKEVEEPEVPKDEIELLEEEGLLDSTEPVAPLPPNTADVLSTNDTTSLSDKADVQSSKTEKEAKGDLGDIEVDQQPQSQSQPETETGADTESSTVELDAGSEVSPNVTKDESAGLSPTSAKEDNEVSTLTSEESGPRSKSDSGAKSKGEGQAEGRESKDDSK